MSKHRGKWSALLAAALAVGSVVAAAAPVHAATAPAPAPRAANRTTTRTFLDTTPYTVTISVQKLVVIPRVTVFTIRIPCNAVVVNPSWLLTTGACVALGGDIYVYPPNVHYDLSSGTRPYQGDRPPNSVKVADIYQHPFFNGGIGYVGDTDDDIALLKTETPLTGVRSVALNRNPSFPQANAPLRALNYPSLPTSDAPIPDLFVPGPLVSVPMTDLTGPANSSCTHPFISTRLFDTYYVGRDLCAGRQPDAPLFCDSQVFEAGAALVADTGYGPLLVGLARQISGDCTTADFMRISSYAADFIDHYTQPGATPIAGGIEKVGSEFRFVDYRDATHHLQVNGPGSFGATDTPGSAVIARRQPDGCTVLASTGNCPGTNYAVFYLGAGDDTLTVSDNVPVPPKGIASTTVFAGAGNDTITGGPYEDDLHGMSGNDVLRGMGGNDVLDGGSDANWLDGGYGKDVLLTQNGMADQHIDCGPGLDTLYSDKYDRNAKPRIIFNCDQG